MATMYSLFFGLLFIAICHTVGVGDHTIVEPSTYSWQEDNGLRTTGCESQETSHEKRAKIIRIATDEIGIREATGNNDGLRVEEYLAYTKLGKGYAWCAAFVSWCYGQAGLSQPRNPWSPALFPKSKTYYTKGQTHLSTPTETDLSNSIELADVFGIYGHSVRRINHVGLVKATQGSYIITIEGNSNNRVESKRRPISTLYALADWISEGGG